MKIKLSDKLKYIAKEYKLGDFVRNLIAVVLGIIITFVGSDWISERNTQKEVEKSIQLVKSELILNRETLKEMGSRVVFEQNAARYLFEYKNKKDEISQDSVKQYLPVIFQWSKYTFINDAMEMLKTSSLIQKIKNKELSLQIIKAYGTIKTAESSFEMYKEYKKQAQDEFNANPQVAACFYNQIKKREKVEYSEENDLSEELYLVLTLPEGLGLLQTMPNILNPKTHFSASIEELDETIAAIDKEYK